MSALVCVTICTAERQIHRFNSLEAADAFRAGRPVTQALRTEEAEHQADAADMQMEADFALMSGELSRLIPALVDVLGGEQKDEVA